MAPALVIALAAAQLAGRTLALEPAQSTVRFHVNHKLHKVDGQARTVEAKAAVGPDGRVLAMVRIPVTSLDSGDANRDANMREVLDVARYPFIVFKGVGNVSDTSPGASTEVTLKGELDLHGVKQPVEVPARVEVAKDGTIRLRGTTHISLEAFRIERPSLLLVKLDDDCRIDLDILLRDAKS